MIQETTVMWDYDFVSFYFALDATTCTWHERWSKRWSKRSGLFFGFSGLKVEGKFS